MSSFLSCFATKNVIGYYKFNVADAVGLTFTNNAVMLHHGYKSTLMTPMGINIKTLQRRDYSVEAVSSSKYLLSKG
jgi:hypothetical protein